MKDMGRRLGTATAVVALSVTGHLTGGGTTPSVVALLLVLVLAQLFAALITMPGRRRRTPTLAAAISAFQVCAHAVLHHVAGQGPAPVGALTGHGTDPCHPGLALAHAPGGDAGADLVSHAADTVHAHGLSPLMLTTHLLATVLLAWLLGPAVDHVRHTLRGLTLALTLTPSVRRATAGAGAAVHDVPAWVSREVDAGHSLRGPPRFALCA